MLLDNLFLIHKLEITSGSVQAGLTVNWDHAILQGHFPGTPIVPGVCMMQAVKELVERHEKQSLMFSSVGQMKFLSVMSPGGKSSFEARILIVSENDALQVTGTLSDGPTIYFKIKAVMIER